MRRGILLAASLAAAGLTGCHRGGGVHGEVAHAEDESSAPVTLSLQGGGVPTCEDPLTRGEYNIYVAAFAQGPDKVDLAVFEQKTYAYIRSYAASQGWPAGDGDKLVDHLKDIPRQFIQIVKDDPKVLDSCEAFSLAMSGPP